MCSSETSPLTAFSFLTVLTSGFVLKIVEKHPLLLSNCLLFPALVETSLGRFTLTPSLSEQPSPARGVGWSLLIGHRDYSKAAERKPTWPRRVWRNTKLRGHLPFIFWISLIIVWMRRLSSVLVTAVQREMKKLESLEKQEAGMIKGLEKLVPG